MLIGAFCFAVGLLFLSQLIIHRFDMGIHGVPHAIAIGGLFYGIIFLGIGNLIRKKGGSIA